MVLVEEEPQSQPMPSTALCQPLPTTTLGQPCGFHPPLPSTYLLPELSVYSLR